MSDSDNIRTYTFYESGVIPGIPRDQGGEGHAGQQIDIDLSTMTAVDSRLIQLPVEIAPILKEDSEMPKELRVSVQTPGGVELEQHIVTVHTPEDNISIQVPSFDGQEIIPSFDFSAPSAEMNANTIEKSTIEKDGGSNA